MLEPGYFQDKCDRMIEIYRELENYILNDIAQRLLKAGEMSGTADRMVWKLTQMGEHRSTILAKLSKITKKSRSELKRLLQEAVLTSWDDDSSTLNKMGIVPSEPLKNKDVMRLMDAEYIKSNGELENLTRTTLDKSQKDLINMLDTAEVRVAAGVQSYSSAICGILDDYAEDGIRVGYPTGAERTLESAVRMIVVTSMNQTSAQVTNYYIAEGNVEYVLVSAHLGARPQAKGQPYLAGHENWQGRAYKIRGSEEGFPNLLESTGYDITQDGKGRVADPRGLHGYNCRHSHRPWDKDLRNPYLDENGNLNIDTEENRRIYELQQRQRAMERGIRKTKRELLVKKQELDGIAETDVKDILQPQYDKLALKLREQNKAYGDYCEQNGFDRQEDRLKAAGFKRKQAAEANGRATAESNRKKTAVAQARDVTDEYLKNAKPNDGNVVYGSGYKIKGHGEEIKTAQWIHNNFGGNITLLPEATKIGIKTPDYQWRGKLWELKNTTTEKSVDSAVRKALKQTSSNSSGIILNFGKNEVSWINVERIITDRVNRSSDHDVDIMILSDEKLYKVLQYKK